MQPLARTAFLHGGTQRGLWIFVTLGTLLGLYSYSDYVFEDAYITLRFSQNLAGGEGLVFQPGEAILGTSTPLWALVLALCIGIGIPPEPAVDLCFAGSLGLLAWAGYQLLARAGLPRAGSLFALTTVAGFAQVHAYWGMEAPLFVALLLLSWRFACDGRSLATGAALGAACLARYEGYAFAACLLPAYSLSRGWRPARCAGSMAGLVTALWLLGAWLFYGSPLPVTCAAKSTDSSATSYLIQSLRRLPDEIWLPLPSELSAIAPALCVALALGSLGGLLLLVRRQAWLLLALPAGAMLMLAVLAGLAPSPIFAWHRTPILYVLLVTALLGIGPWLERQQPAASLSRFAMGGMLVFIPTSQVKLSSTYNYLARVGAYQDMADFLQQPALTSRTLLTGEPGYLAFRTGLRMIDAAGLITAAPPEPARGDWDSGFPPEADLLLLRAPYRPRGFEVVYEGPMGARLMLRTELTKELRPDLDRYYAQDDVNPVASLSEGPHPIKCALARSRGPVHAAQPRTTATLSCNGKPRALTADSQRLRLDQPYLIADFDTNHLGQSKLQLVVRGQIVRSTGPGAAPQDGRVLWDVRPFAGRVARVRVLVLTGSGARAHYGTIRGCDSPCLEQP